MKIKYLPYLKALFRNDLERENINPNPIKPLMIDGKIHNFLINTNGAWRKAYYQAHYDSFDEDDLVLIGSYGLEKCSDRYVFSKSIHQLMTQ